MKQFQNIKLMKPKFIKCFWFKDKLILIYKKFIEVVIPEH